MNDMTDWISINKKLPEPGKFVLCTIVKGSSKPFVRLLTYNKYSGYNVPHFWNGALIADKYVTHWMPLPKPANSTKEDIKDE